MDPKYKIGVDGGGSKTEVILVDEAGELVARHLAPGCNPNVVGVDQARLVLLDALGQIHRPEVVRTDLYMAGAPQYWQGFATSLTGFGRVSAHDDSLPVLELATGGKAGLVLHGGTGSFVAARTEDGKIHYAGGLGWRFGDPGSGYDLGRRAISRALLELQGWIHPSRLGQLVRDHVPEHRDDVVGLTRHFYQHPEANREIASLAPAVLHLASEGDLTAAALVRESADALLELAVQVATKLFPDTPLDAIPAGLSGPILTHSTVFETLTTRCPLPFEPLRDHPIVGVQRLLAHD